jgi:hypothetical protein
MQKTLLLLAIVLVLVPVCAFAIDGQVLINQSTVMAAGGFPYNIMQTGSYKLSGNLVVPAGVDGIVINADNVTLDLNGFTIQGGGGAIGNGVFFAKVAKDPNLTVSKSTVKNGSVTGFGSDGINLGAGSVVADVHADGNGNVGINLLGGVITRCTANSNNTGVVAVQVTLSDSTASKNSNVGISASYSTLIQNVVTNNTVGISAGVEVVFGSNVLHNATDVSGGTSQNNNVCSGGPC